MYLRWRRICTREVLGFLLGIGVFLTFVKWGLNQLSLNLDPMAPSFTYKEATKRNNVVMKVELYPCTFDWNGRDIELSEAWIERRVSLEYWLVWFRHYKDEGGYYLSFTTKEGAEVFWEDFEPYFRISNNGETFTTQMTAGKPVTFTAFSKDCFELPMKIELVSHPSNSVKNSFVLMVRRLQE